MALPATLLEEEGIGAINKRHPTPQASDDRIGFISSFVSLRNPEYGTVPTLTAFDAIGSSKTGQYGAPLTKKLSKEKAMITDFSDKHWVDPMFSEWLMGWPKGWTQSGALDKQVFQQWKELMRKGAWWESSNYTNKLIKIKNEEHENEIKARLRAIGNGQVPMCVYVIWKLLEAGGTIKNGKFMKNTKPKIQAIIRGE